MNRAIATRTLSLVKRIGLRSGDMVVAMSGGVANNEGVVMSLGEALGMDINVPENPDIVGAIGAAVIALESYKGCSG